jgi:cell division protein FtsL
MAIEVVFEKHINNATVYREVDVEQRRQIYLLTSLAVLFGLGVLLYGWQQFQWIRLGYEIESFQKQKEALLDYQNTLIVERETLTQFERIVSIAQDKLGMVVAAPGQIVTLTPEDLPPGEPATAEKAAAPLTAQEVR